MPEKTTAATDAFQEGTVARVEGLKLRDNPYALQTDQHLEWKAGWSATFDLDEDRDPESTRVDGDEVPDATTSLPEVGG
ncbi:hypothetical protein [Lichenifustis flavocetrariae]|uniref:Uncharacterized protein n=1 Tax=Lichenifustis flavocetrariae TaxID=2949735 RepID=A0AA42CPR8_9HYPH|nr:hypothetical protein [Lichenifustis flavocetrariae]MCW6510685.1 hypothetical protein [Lichenifustis flavocetrariae]